MTTSPTCPQCGAPLAAGVAQGLCPKCLMNQGFASQASQPGEASQSGVGPTSAYGSAFAAPAPAELGRHFPHLEIVELLGQGGMGAVYKARQSKLDRWVALKILPREVAQTPGFAERFQREARALAQLNHPNIVGVYDFGESDGLFYFLMEFVDGTSLRKIIESHELQPETALAIVPQVCDALAFAHAEGIVHRDIKPDNILVDKKGRVKIADFGLAKLLGRAEVATSLTGTHQVMGTLTYMAPEQLERPQVVDHRADIYSLGVVLYEMLTGELPLGRFSPPSAMVQLDVRLDEIVFRALEKDRERRYQHASDVKTDVQAVAHTATGESAAPRASPRGKAPAPDGDDFLVFNPRLPKIAQWICGYALVVRPVLLLLSLVGLVVFRLDEGDYVVTSELVDLPIGLLTVALLFGGGLRLRSLRARGVSLLKAGFALELIWAPLYFVWLIGWSISNPAVAAQFDAPGTGRDFVSLLLVVLCLAFDVFALTWLVRFGRRLVG